MLGFDGEGRKVGRETWLTFDTEIITWKSDSGGGLEGGEGVLV